MDRGPSLGTKSLTNKPASAEAILAHVLKRLGWTSRYRKGLLDGPEHLRLLEAVRAFSKAWLRHEAAQFARQYLAVEEKHRDFELAEGLEVRRSVREQAFRFFRRMKTFVRESIVAGAMALVGPRPLTGSELQQAERQAVVQDAYIDKFLADMMRPYPINPSATTTVVVSPPPITPNQFIARAESYGACVWGYAQEIARETIRREAVFDEEHLVLGDAEHCEQCLADNARGFVPIGTLGPIGSRECRTNCACRFVYRNSADGIEYVAGRGPLDEDAFGRTG